MNAYGELKIFPAPQEVQYLPGNPRPVRPTAYSIRGGNERIAAWCRREALPLGGGEGTMELRLVRRRDESTLYLEGPRRLTDEKYFLTVSEAKGRLSAQIVYGEERGLRHALRTLVALHRAGGFVPCEIEDFPSFPVRGIVEGFYGPPWTHEERLDMMRLIADYRMNTYVYAPKDDPYHRERWAALYDERSLGRLAALHRAAEDEGLDFWYSIGPGLSFRYSDNDAFEKLAAKLMQIHALGVRDFALLLDDIPPFLQFAEDKQHYTELIEAQISLASRLHEYLLGRDSSIRLAVCPTEYHGRGNEYTVSRLGRSLHPAVDLFWTGPEICSRELTTRDAALFGEATLHLPLYWDNYPVNDLAMANEMHIGPYRSRDADLHRFSRGIIANGMQYPEASKIPIATIACYAWNPEGYDPEQAYEEAILRVVGETEAADFALFADNVRASCLNEDESPRIAEALERFRFAFLHGDPIPALAALDGALEPFSAAAERLLGGLQNQKLGEELAPWLEKYAGGIALLRAAASSLGGEDARSDVQSLQDHYNDYMKNPTRVFADVLDQAIAQIIQMRGEK